VRYNTLMVLTHLILNDMVKVKGQVCHVVLCILDNDSRVADLARVFFNELSKRSNNPIYNLMGDIVAILSRDESDINPETETDSKLVNFNLS
jgi:condensin complex subunit 1